MVQIYYQMESGGGGTPPSVGETVGGPTGPDTKPIGSFPLCCLWLCEECTWIWGGSQWNPPTGTVGSAGMYANLAPHKSYNENNIPKKINTKETIVGPYSMEDQSEIENSFQEYLKTVDISRNGSSDTEKGIKILAPKSAHGSTRDKKHIDPIVLTNGWDSGSSVVPYYVCADAPWPIGTGAGCYEGVNGLYTNNNSSSPNFGFQYPLPCQPWHQGGSCYGFLWPSQIPATYPNEKACNDNCLYS